MTTTQLRKVLNDVSEKVTGDTMIAPSVEDYLNEWLAGVVTRNSPATDERYANTVRLFLLDLTGNAKQPVTAVPSKDVDHFLTSRLKSGAAPKTAIVDLKTLNTAFRRAEAYGTILKNPVAAVRPPKEECSEWDIFTHEEWQTLILLGYFVGARLGDCVQMKWDNVYAEQGVVIYHQKRLAKRSLCPCTTILLST